MDAVLAVLDAVDAPFEWDSKWRTSGHRGLLAIPCRKPRSTAYVEHDWRSKGHLQRPSGEVFESVNVRMREEFGLYANVRPVGT